MDVISAGIENHYASDSNYLVFEWEPINYIRPVEYIHNLLVPYSNKDSIKSINDENMLDSQRTIEMFQDSRILIVDDQSFNLDALKIVLKYCIGLDS
jgi:PleD family two-component response regulator